MDSLQPLFDALPRDLEGDAAALMEPILDWPRWALGGERRITVFGAHKSGKSTLINALMGVPLLPARGGQTPAITVTIRYGDAPHVSLLRESDGAVVHSELPFDTVMASWLSLPPDVEEVRMMVPLPLLRLGCVLVDTPGLLQDEARTSRALRALEMTDLAIMVLSADKILSARERDIARWATDLLCGNVAYVVNRMDTVEAEERADVLEWARTALRTSGNELIGRPRIFAAGLDGGTGPSGVEELGRWLAQLFGGPAGGRVARLSRLGILRRHLVAAIEGIEPLAVAAQAEAERLRAGEEAVLQRERATFRGQIAQARVRVRAVRGALDSMGEAFVAACAARARRDLESGRGKREAMHLHVEDALQRYAETLREEMSKALAGAPLTAPTFQLGDWIVHAQVEPAANRAGELAVTLGDLITRPVDGGKAGREAGELIGSWIGKRILKVDVEEETLKRVEGVARAILPSLRREAERYLDRVLSLLDERDVFYTEWKRPAPHVDEAEAERQRYRLLLEWCRAALAQTESMLAREGE